MSALLITKLLQLLESFGRPSTCLNTPLRWLSLFQVIVRSQFRTRCEIKVFDGGFLFVLSLCFLVFSVSIRAFVIGMNQIL